MKQLHIRNNHIGGIVLSPTDSVIGNSVPRYRHTKVGDRYLWLTPDEYWAFLAQIKKGNKAIQIKREASMTPKAFNITEGTGFHLRFPNGITLSTQIGIGNYCDNRHEERLGSTVISKCAEVAIWKTSDDTWLTKKMYGEVFGEEGADDTIGWVTLEDWSKIIKWCIDHEEV